MSGNAERKRTRIQAENEARIIAAALEIFSSYGFRGSTVDQIALTAGMSKANVLYYFRRKQDIYHAVLTRTLTDWLDPLEAMDPDGDPLEEIWQYTQAKLELSRQAPEASRLFANEILQGAPVIGEFLRTELRELVDRKCALIQAWIDQGKLASVTPVNLLFLIWSATQHYADFQPQIDALDSREGHVRYQSAEATLRIVLHQGLKPVAESPARVRTSESAESP